jgi:thioredoxin reductase
MGRADSVGATLGTTADTGVDRDVVVVGGGAAGLSAAVFLSRYGLDTLVLARGKAAITQCAHLENYLGFPGGVSPERFLALGRSQIELEGGTVREELVEEIEPADLPSPGAAGPDARDPGTGGFRVESDEGEYLTRYVLVATAYDGNPFDPLDADVEPAAERSSVTTDAGRTPVEGLYAAGWVTDETVHQAAVNAGHGARAGVALARDALGARFWPALGEQYKD